MQRCRDGMGPKGLGWEPKGPRVHPRARVREASYT